VAESLKRQSEPSSSQVFALESRTGVKGNCSCNESDPQTIPEEYVTKRKYQSTEVAPKLVSKQPLSTRIASDVLQSSAEEWGRRNRSGVAPTY